MNATLRTLLQSADEWASIKHLRFFGERSGLVVVNFHKLFRDRREIDLALVDPQNETTVDDFRRVVEYFLANGYQIVSPAAIIAGLSGDKKYAFVTFDDGYFNNHRALPILNEYKVPATFMIASNHVRAQVAFWWDVLFREGRKRGISVDRISREQWRLRSMPYDHIDNHIRATLGAKALRPVGDLDRPFSSTELRDLASQNYVSIGNHTNHHAFLPRYPIDEARAEISDAQDALREMTGALPEVIAYPYGAYTDEIATLAQSIGLRLGFVGEKQKNEVPIRLSGIYPLRLTRFAIWGNRNIEDQCARFRSDIHLLAAAGQSKKKWTHRIRSVVARGKHQETDDRKRDVNSPVRRD